MMLLSCVFLFSTGLNAQDGNDSLVWSIDFEDVVITAQYQPTHYKSALHEIDIIKRDLIEKRGATTLDQALITNSSIRINQDPILGSSVSLRGIRSSNVAILLDGVPVIGRLDGGIDISQLSTHNLQRIEIVEGALSNIYGNNAAGGVINLITKKQQNDKWNLNASQLIESTGILNSELSAGFKKNKWTVNLNGRYFDYNQYPVDSLRLEQDILLEDGSTLTLSKYAFNPKTQINVGSFISYDINNNSSLNLRLANNTEKVTNYGPVKRPQFQPYGMDQDFKTLRRDVALTYRTENSQSSFSLDVSYNNFNRQVSEIRTYIENGEKDSLYFESDTSSFDLYFARAIYCLNLNPTTKLVAGINLSRESGKAERINNPDNEDASTAVFNEYAPFIEIKYNGIENLNLSASGRYTQHSIYAGKFTPALHLKYKINNKLNLRGSYAMGYRSPTLKELYLDFLDINHDIQGNADLNPETSTDIQLSLDFTPGSTVNIGIKAYHTTINDQIGLFQYGDLQFIYNNLDKYISKGLQTDFSINKEAFQFNTNANFGFWSTEIGEETNSRDFMFVLDLNSTLTYAFKNNWSTTLNFRHVGRQSNYSQDEMGAITINQVEAYNLIDCSVNKRLLEGKLNITAGIKNLLDVQSINITNGSSTSHGTTGRSAVNLGRSGFVTVAFGI